jgi:arginase
MCQAGRLLKKTTRRTLTSACSRPSIISNNHIKNIQEVIRQHSLENNEPEKSLGFVSADWCEGQGLKGTDRTGKIFRDKYLSRLPEYKIRDAGDLPFPTEGGKYRADPKKVNARNCEANGIANKLISNACYAQAQDPNQFVLTVGGDHSISFGSIHGVLRARPDTVVFWVDAHADFNTPESSISGNMHGMPAAAHCGLFNFSSLPGWSWFRPRLDVSSIVFIGLRDLDEFEKRAMKALGIQAYSIHDVEKLGISEVMNRSLNSIPGGQDRPIHLSFDIDGIDPTYAPSTGTILDGGLSLRESRYICTSLAETGRLKSMDMVEINPSISIGAKAHCGDTIEYVNEEELHPNALRTLDLGWDLVECGLGKTLL